jgi:hypothetical protein
MNFHLLLLAVYQQQFMHSLKVGGRLENILSVVAAQDDVMRVIGDGETGKACHGAILIGI